MIILSQSRSFESFGKTNLLRKLLRKFDYYGEEPMSDTLIEVSDSKINFLYKIGTITQYENLSRHRFQRYLIFNFVYNIFYYVYLAVRAALLSFL